MVEEISAEHSGSRSQPLKPYCPKQEPAQSNSVEQVHDGKRQKASEPFSWERFNQTLQQQPNVTELLSLLYSDV